MDWLRSGLLIMILTLSVDTQLPAQNPFDLPSRLQKSSQPDSSATDSVMLNQQPEAPPSINLAEEQNPDQTPVLDSSPPTLEQESLSEPPEEIGRVIEEIEEDLPHVSVDQNVLFGVILIVLLALAILMMLQRSMLHNTYRAVSNDNYLRFLFRDYQNRTLIYHAYYGYFFINAGLFLYLISLREWSGETANLIYLPVFLLGISLIYLIRHLVLSVLGQTFPVSKEAGLFGFIIMLINIVLGLVLTPLNIGLAFGPPTLYKSLIIIGLIAFAFLYLFRQLKGIFISGRILNGYLFHFFLYFCIVEIAPLLVIGKLAAAYLGVH